MLRPSRLHLTALLAALAFAAGGCKTIYSDIYAPKRSRFVPPKEKIPEVDAKPQDTSTLPDTNSAPPPADPNLTLPPTEPAGAGAIPGLEPAAPAAPADGAMMKEGQ